MIGLDLSAISAVSALGISREFDDKKSMCEANAAEIAPFGSKAAGCTVRLRSVGSA